jgi:hypothetical protein
LPEGSTYGSGLEPGGIKDGNNNFNFMFYSDIFPSTPEQELIDKMQPNVPYLPLSYDTYDYKTKQYVRTPIDQYDIYDITDDINNGSHYLYGADARSDYSYYRDKNTNRIYQICDVLYGTVNEDNFEKIDYGYIKTLLPKRDYIGGTKKDVTLKVINKIPNLRDTILSLASKYGISADLFAQRIGNEGWLQQIAKIYNNASVADQRTFA